MSGWGRNDSIAVTGTVSVGYLGSAVTGAGSAFTTDLEAGEALKISGVDYVIEAILSDTSLTLCTGYLGSAAAGLTVTAANKPTADLTKTLTEIRAVSDDAMKHTPGPAGPGWVYRNHNSISGRTKFETLVAMKHAPVESSADEVIFPDTTTTTSTTTTTTSTTTTTTVAPTTTTTSLPPTTTTTT